MAFSISAMHLPVVTPESSWRQQAMAFARRLSAPVRHASKPDWARVPDRVWRRHSAYLACLHEQDDARGAASPRRSS